MASADVPVPPSRPRPSGAAVASTPVLLFAFLGGQSAYAIHLVASFWLVPAACRVGSTLPLHAVSVVTLTTAVAATAVAIRCWRVGSGRGRGALAPDTPPAAAGGDSPAGIPRAPLRGAGRGYLVALLLRRRRAAAALLAAAVATAPAAGSEEPRGTPAAWPRGTFMAGAGIVLSGLGVALVVFHWIPVVVVDTCA